MEEESEGRIRLAKLIASRGLASRREAEAMILEGRVQVNGEAVTTVATLVNPNEDRVHVDNRTLPVAPPTVWYLMYKPRGYITGRDDPQGRPSVLELVEHLPYRVEPVGRLDFDTEGALLFTNDGDLAHKLTHPSTEVPKRYLAKVYRTPDAGDLRAIQNGVFLEDGKTAPAKARVVDTTDTTNCWLEITVTEGRNRLVRRMLAQLGHPVSKLRRESFATLTIRGMERGEVRALTRAEIDRINEIANGTKPKSAGRFKYKEGFARPSPDKNPRRKIKSRAPRRTKGPGRA